MPRREHNAETVQLLKCQWYMLLGFGGLHLNDKIGAQSPGVVRFTMLVGPRLQQKRVIGYLLTWSWQFR